jgi:hypothetical protein
MKLKPDVDLLVEPTRFTPKEVKEFTEYFKKLKEKYVDDLKKKKRKISKSNAI